VGPCCGCAAKLVQCYRLKNHEQPRHGSPDFGRARLSWKFLLMLELSQVVSHCVEDRTIVRVPSRKFKTAFLAAEGAIGAVYRRIFCPYIPILCMASHKASHKSLIKEPIHRPHHEYCGREPPGYFRTDLINIWFSSYRRQFNFYTNNNVLKYSNNLNI